MVSVNLNQKSSTYSLSHQNLQGMCQDHSKSTSQATLHSLMGSPSLSKCSLANQPLQSAVWEKLKQCHVSYSYHNISVCNVISGLCSSCVLFHKRPSYFYTSVIYSRQWEWKIDNLMYCTVHICTYTCTTYASNAPNTLILILTCDCTSRSSWKHHHISEPSLWILQLACDCNNSRWRGGRSIMENVHTYSLDHLQCKPHQCWLSGEWHSSHCRIPGSRSSYWVQVQGGQRTLWPL